MKQRSLKINSTTQRNREMIALGKERNSGSFANATGESLGVVVYKWT